MAALLIRNLNDETKNALRIRAARNGVSMEEEVRRILSDALGHSEMNSNLADRLLKRFATVRDHEALQIPARQFPRPAPRLGD